MVSTLLDANIILVLLANLIMVSTLFLVLYKRSDANLVPVRVARVF